MDSEQVKPSIPFARCMGPVPLNEECCIFPGGRAVEWSEVSEEKKIEILKLWAREINWKQRSLWIAAERLSNFGEGQCEIYSELLAEGKKE